MSVCTISLGAIGFICKSVSVCENVCTCLVSQVAG